MSDTNLAAARESSRQLSTLLRHEQGAMADFLVALADFDRRGLWRDLGHSCLFYYLQRELRLSDGAAHFRKVAARLIQRFPEVVEPLREGRLCITSIVELARVMTPENREETLPRFFHMSKRQAKAVAAAILPAAVIPRREVVTAVATVVRSEVRPPELRPDETLASTPEREAAPALPMRVEPLTANESRIHMTVTAQFLEKLEAARRGHGHVQPGATKEQVIEAALDLLLEKQAKRRAEVKRPQRNPRPAKPDHVTATVKREVWARDGWKCQWPVNGGGVCGSTTRLEIDHVVPRGKGGPSTVANCRLTCKVHNQYSARQVYGDDHMDLFTRGVPHASEPVAAWCTGESPSTRDIYVFSCGVTSSGPLPPFIREAFEPPTRNGERHDDPDPELDSFQRLEVPRLEGPLRGRLPRHRPRRLRRPDLLLSEELLRLAADGGGFRDRFHERLAFSGGQPHGGR
jgi:5-methylcytosine-specific restriction endonuclease McrA